MWINATDEWLDNLWLIREQINNASYHRYLFIIELINDAVIVYVFELWDCNCVLYGTVQLLSAQCCVLVDTVLFVVKRALCITLCIELCDI